MQKRVWGKRLPQYVPSRAIPELEVEPLIVPCHRELKNGDIVTERIIKFKVYPRTGADPQTAEDCLKYFRLTIKTLQAIMDSDKFPVEKKDKHAENYNKAFDIIVTRENRLDLVNQLNVNLSISSKHIQSKIERSSTSGKQ